MKSKKTIVLASTSPRRKSLLEKTGLKFKIVKSKFKEYLDPKLEPHKLVEKLSLNKAKAVYEKYKNNIIISADTVVACNGKVVGKPKDKAEAKRMLKFLNGKPHSIITGFTIIDGEKVITKSESTKIWMRKLDDQEIDDYIASKEPLDKAGAYAIQGKGSTLIEKFEGDFNNAVGLPIQTLLTELGKLSV